MNCRNVLYILTSSLTFYRARRTLHLVVGQNFAPSSDEEICEGYTDALSLTMDPSEVPPSILKEELHFSRCFVYPPPPPPSGRIRHNILCLNFELAGLD